MDSLWVPTDGLFEMITLYIIWHSGKYFADPCIKPHVKFWTKALQVKIQLVALW